jgi:hypothetical protein
MTLRWIHQFGYRLTDTAWLMLREIEYLAQPNEEVEGRKTEEADWAFTF